MSERVQVNMHEAKSILSQLAERAWCGDKVMITKGGRPYLDLLLMSIHLGCANLGG
ncbi:type II toxin-antitoxin system Phd/YefM family antitoxin [Pseudomonas sp. P97.38]|uniref:type II toxin-antitoxin system Phd/YefM family antitoxin n=1 Tax=Pseudomonas sp. P97.38 TaxID=255451 RepID=UPI000A4ABAD9|nr:hypothetical protein [Pseudomonas sp. P97.38]